MLSEELRGLLHAIGGHQGRTVLILPPGIPEQLPALVEYDRTFAYAKHLWKSPVGTPRRITAAAFAAMSEAEQTKALMSCSALERAGDRPGQLEPRRPAGRPGHR
ncbi:hypothetical protein [Kitasatospora sp. NPDC001547]|uniref:hypothetical protein n=1 Tax=Kitasatospora sp. NPDC001547 TaxID=3364015 RepID=UPI00368DFC87